MGEDDSNVDVTVAIVNWNTRDLLAQCLDSLKQEAIGVRAQVIVVDNGSQDGSAEMVRSRFPEAELVSNNLNWGFARANNQAFARARGRYFLFLNPDTIVRPRALSKMVEFLDAHQEAAGVTCKLLNPDGTFQRYYKRLPTWMIVLATFTVFKNLDPDNRRSRAFYMRDDAFDSVREVEQPPATCLMLRRSLLSGQTVLDERFPILFNDIDLCRSLKERGLRLYFLPSAEVVHYGSAGGVGQMKDDAIIDYLICLVRYYRKYEGRLAAALLWIILTVNTFMVLTVGLIKTAIGRKDRSLLKREFRKRIRLFIGREMFQYPLGFRPTIP